jgi:hypothetical protein
LRPLDLENDRLLDRGLSNLACPAAEGWRVLGDRCLTNPGHLFGADPMAASRGEELSDVRARDAWERQRGRLGRCGASRRNARRPLHAEAEGSREFEINEKRKRARCLIEFPRRAALVGGDIAA